MIYRTKLNQGFLGRDKGFLDTKSSTAPAWLVFPWLVPHYPTKWWVFQQSKALAMTWPAGDLSWLPRDRGIATPWSASWPCPGGIDGSVEERLLVPVGRIGHLIGKAGWRCIQVLLSHVEWARTNSSPLSIAIHSGQWYIYIYIWSLATVDLMLDDNGWISSLIMNTGWQWLIVVLQ